MAQGKPFALLACLVLGGVALAADPAGFSLSSPDIPSGKPIAPKFIYQGFGCTGQNVSPAVIWKNPPAGTTQLAQGAGTADGKRLPAGARQLTTDFGSPGWGGPCPPEGDKPHRYHFTVYALKADRLELPANATASLAGFMINANALGKANFTGTFGR